MIIGALLIGTITAYYFGLRAGVFAACGAAGLFVFALVMPSKLLWCYGLVGLFILAVLVTGPRTSRQEGNKADFFRLSRRLACASMRLYRKLRG